MEKLLIVAASIAVSAIVALFVLGYRSHSGEAPGLAGGRLQPCPDTPNCVGSEFESDAAHTIEPLVYPADQAARVVPRLKAAIRELGGSIEAERGDYLAATFTSPVFRFVDDLELRIDRDRNTIHLRSASRVGRNDLGANRKRAERLKNAFRAKTD
jgi:uncharacterized protein (DUF1499 family)